MTQFDVDMIAVSSTNNLGLSLEDASTDFTDVVTVVSGFDDPASELDGLTVDIGVDLVVSLTVKV